ncbi:GNAT family N-acetyltransferase [Flavivirga aquatica]|uniref:GNAT family N-acetyltransferase n=2 Tax=Flavivirga aquatica TaxID=1849968 RepID=A0A1E5TBE7_9FLAO|nr:GNAT family N-acetyltransferase [Flavivirga aquatica]
MKDTNTFFPVYRLNNEKKKTSSFDVISSKEDWVEALDSVKNYDFYHTYDYHNLSKEKDEKAVLLKYIEEDKIICLPIIIRKIEGTEYCDITSVYGYSGPIQKNIDPSFDNTNLLKELNAFFEEHKIVSVFSRLNPFINNQENILNNLGEVVTIGNVVNVDVTKDLDAQRTDFSKTTKRYLNKANKHLEIKISRDKKDIVEFINLYYENMDRVNAEEKYYFTEEYFHKLINSTDYETDVLFAINKETNKIISAAMMIKTNNIIQYHLSGTKSSFLNLSPIRLLIDEMRIRGTKENYTYFNLGGGLGNNNDELFRFKSSFSKDFKSFKIWRHIVNQSVYDKLVKEKTKNQESTFFPLYRG